MSNINVAGLLAERGEAQRVIDLNTFEQRTAGLSKKVSWREMITKYGGKKLKVYGYDEAIDRVWMSADHSDTYHWRPFMLENWRAPKKAAPAPLRNAETFREAVAKANVSPDRDMVYERPTSALKKSKNSKLLKLMLVMSMMNTTAEKAEPKAKAKG